MRLSADKKLELVKRNLVEIIGEEELENLITAKKKPVVYWGTAPTGRPHVGYFLPGLKIADLLNAGFKVKILLADLHAALDNVPWEVLEHRYFYYKGIIPLMISAMGGDVKNLEFVKGSDFQLEKDYVLDLMKLTSFTSFRDAKKAAAEVVKNIEGESAKLSGFIYPLMQSLDEEYLGCNAQLGGLDQRKIMVLARQNLPKLNYDARIELMNPIIPGLIGKKMSSSDEKGKIDLIDYPETIMKKLRGAEMVAKDPDNGVMAFLKYVIMTVKKDKGEKFVIERPVKYGGNLEYEIYSDLEKDYVKGDIHPLDLKNAVAKEIIELLKPIEKKRKQLEKLSAKAYS